MKRKTSMAKIKALLGAIKGFKKGLIPGLLLLMLSMAIFQSGKCDLNILNTTPTFPQRFRILVVEGHFDFGPQRSGEYLIRALTQFENWKNGTEYMSFIELLSEYNSSQVFEDVREFLKDRATKANLRDRILNFLGAAQPDEKTIFYCNTFGAGQSIYLDEEITASELASWLKPGIGVILDACFSGAMINDGLPPGNPLGAGRIVQCSSKSDQISWGYVNDWSWFTGTDFFDGLTYKGPLGIIGGLFGGANDTNKDGWISFSENFEFAQSSTEIFASYRNKTQTPVSFNGREDLPFVLIPEPSQPPVANFSYTPTIPWINETVNFNASTSYDPDGTITDYKWNFGDGNITSTVEPLITHKYNKEGNYTVVLNVTDSQGLWNSTSSMVTVTYRTDLNRDRTVNILDISAVAAAYNTRPGDLKWNEICDFDKNEWINIIDISTVARDYGKSV